MYALIQHKRSGDVSVISSDHRSISDVLHFTDYRVEESHEIDFATVESTDWQLDYETGDDFDPEDYIWLHEWTA